MPPSDTQRPNFSMPSGACDCHCHVFGPADRFPFAAARRYEPIESPKEVLASLHRELGVDRAVIVQASAHGTDNSAMLDALAWQPSKYRGIAIIDEEADDRHIRDLSDAGVRGARFNFVKSLGGPPDLDVVRTVVARITPFNWHLVMHIQGNDICELSEFIAGLRVPFVIDHMARLDARLGTAQPAFRTLLEIMELPNAWIKLSGFERMCAKPYDAALPFAKILADAFSDKILFGTDFPHPNLHVPVREQELIDLIPLYAPDERTRRKLLVENPARLYDF